MPVQRLNFTNRSSLTLEQANVLIHPGTPATFEFIHNLSHLLESAPGARVFVEAYHGTTRMRFDFGTVANVKSPAHNALRLTEFPDWKHVKFRVKITDVTVSPGRIVAWANKIKPKGPEDDTLKDLVLWKDAELNGRLWDLDLSVEEGPVGLVEKSVGYANVAQDPRFRAAAYPEILRRTLNYVLVLKKLPIDDTENWFSDWYNSYLKGKLRLPDAPDTNDIEACIAWIDQAVVVFGSEFKIFEQWTVAAGTKGVD